MKTTSKLALKEKFQLISNLPDAEWNEFEDHCSIVKYKKGEIILQAGHFESRMGLITVGLVKRTVSNDKGKEFIQFFGEVGSFSGPYSAILQRRPSTVTITAIEETEMILFNMYEYQKFYDRHKAWERIARISLEKYFIDRERREFQLLVLDAKQRYEEFLTEFANCHERLTNKDIASYLRITPEAFSRLLNKKVKADNQSSYSSQSSDIAHLI